MNFRTLGKILGALGLVALLSAPYTYFVTTGSPWMAAVKAILGVFLVGAYFATNLGEFGQFASRRSTFYLVSTLATVLVVLVGLVAVNYVVVKKGKSWDLTTKKIFTLAPQTKSALGALKEKVRAYAFLAPSDPDYEQVDRLLQRYREQAPEKLEVVFKDPRKAPDLAQKYQLREGQTTLVLTRGTGDKENTPPSRSPTGHRAGLTNALIKLNAVGEQRCTSPATASGRSSRRSRATRPPERAQDADQEGCVPGTINLPTARVPRTPRWWCRRRRSKFGGRGRAAGEVPRPGGRMLYFAESAAERTGPAPGEVRIRSTRGWWPTTSTPSTARTWSSRTSSRHRAGRDRRAQYNVQFPPPAPDCAARGPGGGHPGGAGAPHLAQRLRGEGAHREPTAAERGQGGQSPAHRPVDPERR
jgi:hypothetical protein